MLRTTVRPINPTINKTIGLVVRMIERVNRSQSVMGIKRESELVCIDVDDDLITHMLRICMTTATFYSRERRRDLAIEIAI